MLARAVPASEGVSPPEINLARLDLVSMRLLLECAARGSLSAAASHCHLSVAGASHRLARLEDALGTQLFYRHHRGLKLTEAGAAATGAAKAMMLAVDQLVQGVREAARSMPTGSSNTGRRRKGIDQISCSVSE
ncbi:LysR family transcriptional regulator [Ramlibacter sp. WS9]|nr:LysR family transcriptional regulator [Ramlibacter sp. WS9]